MKKKNFKRLISLITAALVVCSVSVCAMADYYAVKVTVKNGDTLDSICRQHGVDFYQNKELIMRLNGISDAKQLNRILVGSVIEIPSSAADAAGMNTAAGIPVVTRNGAAVTRSSGPVTIVAGDASGMGVGDSVKYYIVLYTVQPGDTLLGLYNKWNMDYTKYQNQIMALNGMSDLDTLVVGKMLYLPVNRADITGTANYAIVSHDIAYGETVYGICQKFSLDFNAASACLQSFNPSVSFSKISAGQSILIPVSLSSARAAANTNSYASAYTNTYTTTAAYTSANAYTSDAGYAISSAGVVSTSPVNAAASEVAGNIPANPEMPVTDVVYDGYAVVLSNSGYLSLRLEEYDMDVNVLSTAETLNGYVPTPGDYVKVIFTPTDFLLVSVQRIYNVFTGC